ncbi:hypothetical protein WMF27_41405 [Sorangium sp. So ce281]|uniref:hypothetical protein n=1 Tax=unclassified Sorangium TaxID=2621164 RepID=UPI003F600B00
MKAEKDTVLRSCKLLLRSDSGELVEQSPYDGQGGLNEALLRKAYAEIEADRKTMRYGMVIGKLNVVNGKIDETATNYITVCPAASPALIPML